MRKQLTKTGNYGISLMIHSVHMTGDVPCLNRFYGEVFGGLVYMGVDEPNYLEGEDRWAALILISDLCIEMMSPNFPVDPHKPVSKYGEHLHSVGYLVDDLVGLGERMLEKGIHIVRPGGARIERMDDETGYFYPTPRQTAGLMVELCGTHMPGDPRELETWSSRRKFWELSHPLGIKRLLYMTLGVKDLESAVATYIELLQAVPVTEGIDDGGQYRYTTLHLGDCLLQLAEPLGPDSPLGEHVARWGNMIYSIRFRVNDLDSAEQWLNRNDIKTSRPRPGMLAADPADTFTAPYFFTTDVVQRDPYA